jgi:hypothetical protein
MKPLCAFSVPFGEATKFDLISLSRKVFSNADGEFCVAFIVVLGLAIFILQSSENILNQ